MPKLHHKLDGTYCIVGNVPGIGFCTWQVGQQALDFLHGVRNVHDGGEVVLSDLRRFLDEGWIWTGGGGTGGPVATSESEGIPHRLVLALTKWAGFGLAQELGRALAFDGRDFWDKCFCRPFLKWLADLSADMALADFEAISSPDFVDLARDKLSRLDSPLHQQLVRHSWTLVPWRLSRVVGCVAQHAEANDLCPLEWQTGFPVLARLFDLVRSFCVDQAKKAGGTSGASSKRYRHALVSPYIRWDIDDQSVVAVLPPQRLQNKSGLRWGVSGAKLPQPDLVRDGDVQRTAEVRSEPLDPACVYQMTVTSVTSTFESTVYSKKVELPVPRGPVILFSSDGRLIDLGADNGLSPGEYLALVPVPAMQEAKSLTGVTIVDTVDFEPVGWEEYRGLRVELASDAHVPPYRVEASDRAIDWKMDAPPDYGVRFLSALPVWVGHWPLFCLSDADAFSSAIVEIDSHGHLAAGRSSFHLTVGRDVTIRSCDGEAVLDLSAASNTSDVYGRLQITCRLPSYPDLPPLVAEVLRAPVAEFAYVEDPRQRRRASAVRISTRERIEPTIDSELLQVETSIILRSRNPLESPAASFAFPEAGLQLDVRVPVTRVRYVSREGLGPWCDPPLNIALRNIRLDDCLRVELHQPALLEDGQLLCRLVGGAEVAAGKPTELLHTYVIPLHRWRDDSRLAAGGVVQVRSHREWIDIACLEPAIFTQRPTEMQAPPERKLSERQRSILELEDALARDDRGLALRLAEALARRSCSNTAARIDSELLPYYAARAHVYLGNIDRAEGILTSVAGRTDLQEAQILRSTIDLRIGRLPSRDDLKTRSCQIRNQVTECPQKHTLLAEFDYHYASQPGRANAIWGDCLHTADVAASMSETARWPLSVEHLDSLLLKEIASFMLGREAVRANAVPTHGPWQWLTCIEFAGRFLRLPFSEGREHLPIPSLPDSIPTVLRASHVALLKTVIGLASQNRVTAEENIQQLQTWTAEEFYAMDLLRARLSLLAGRHNDARANYARLLATARTYGPDFLLDVLLEEMPL